MTRRPTNPSSSGHAVAYRRVSTDEQRESGLGLDAQTAALEQAARRAGLTIRATFTDAGLSGALPIEKRPQLAAALAELHRGDVLLVAKRDRLARDVMQAAMIGAAAKRKGARIVSAAGEGTDDDDPTSVLMRGIIDQFAQYERLVISARTAAALASKRARGQRFTRHAPYGWTLSDDGRTLVDNPAEREMLDTIAECRAAGFSWEGTAHELARLGYLQRNGRPFSLFTVRSAYTRHERQQTIEAARQPASMTAGQATAV